MADILIRGMEIPKTCVQCDLKRYDQERIWTDNGTELLGAWVCKRTDEIIWNTQRGENCPLIPIPAGHGRLVDAEEIRTRLSRKLTACKPGTIEELTFSVSIDIVDHADTIVPAEGGCKDG